MQSSRTKGWRGVRTKIPNQADKMLVAAAKLFGGNRFDKVRMEDIAAAADVGKGTLYRYFQDKEDLFFALLARAAQEIQARIADAVTRTGTARAGLEAFIASGMEYFDEQPHLGPLIQRIEVLSGDESPWQPARDMFFRTVHDLFAQGAANREFTIRDPDHAVHMLVGGARSVVLFGKKPRPNGLATAIVADFLDGAAR
jgi:AcrR family transcriptional regulator